MYDLAIVGAGILGLAHAFHAAKAGARVAVFERHAYARSASIRNFGMLWPIGQPAGERHELATRSRGFWLEILRESGLWHEANGSLHVAFAPDEEAVLREFIDSGAFDVAWKSPEEIARLAPGVKQNGLRGGMFSPTEICVDPREILAGLPAFLAERFGVEFHFSRPVIGFENGRVLTPTGSVSAKKLIVCSGDELALLYPGALADPNLTPCKLQMLRTKPVEYGWRIGPMLAAGLTLRHYASFQNCPSLPALCERLDRESPEFARLGIHVLVSQNGRGELTLGDSHEYGVDALSPFDSDEIDERVLSYLATFFDAPGQKVASRWNGVYLKHRTDPWWIARPAENVTLVTGVGGAGMTLSFGLAERVLSEVF